MIAQAPRLLSRVIAFAFLALLMAVGSSAAQEGPGGGPGGPGGPGGGGPTGPGSNFGGDGFRFNLQSSRTAPLDLHDILPKTDDTVPDGGFAGSASFAAPRRESALASHEGEITLAAHLTDKSAEIPRGLVWRVFKPEPGDDGKLPLVATADGGTSRLHLSPGTYLVHASFGRAGATKRITVSRGAQREDVVLDAGGLELDAVMSGGLKIPPNRLKFSIYEAEPDATGERALIIPDVKPNTVVRLKAGTYHVVSTYGSVNAIIRADIRVEAGKLTEATMEHRAAHLTLKLVREHGGEAIADTAWSILTDGGDVVRETVGAYASLVLAQGDYTIVAKNRDRIYQRDFHVEPGKSEDVEMLPGDQIDETGSDDGTIQE